MIVSSIIFAAAAYANLSWRSVGPTIAGGRVAAVAGTPQDDQLYYSNRRRRRVALDQWRGDVAARL